jgi:hypothetical protein
MNFFTRTILDVVLIIMAICYIKIYGSSLIGFAVLMVFTFMSILILLAANHNDL